MFPIVPYQNSEPNCVTYYVKTALCLGPIWLMQFVTVFWGTLRHSCAKSMLNAVLLLIHVSVAKASVASTQDLHREGKP